MATKQFLSLEGLSTYDSLIKQYIGTEDAKSIKSITVVGNTVSFFKTADASGTASYTVSLPDVSNFLEKLSNPTGGNLVASKADGTIEEIDFSTDELITGYFDDEPDPGQIVIYDGVNADIMTAEVNIDDVLTKLSDATGDKVIVSNDEGEILESDIDISEVLTVLENATGGKVVTTDVNGDIVESDIVANDVLTKLPTSDNGKVVVVKPDGTLEGSSEIYVTGYHFSGSSTVADDIIVRRDYDGREVKPSGISVNNILQKLSNPSGSKIVTSNNDGTITESGVSLSDLASVTYVDGEFDTLDGEITALDQSLSAVAKSGDAEDVAYDNTDSGLTADDVQGAIDELAEASAGGVASKTVYLRDESAGQSDYAKVYKLYQGANAPDAQTDPATLIGTVNIPLDKVVQDGHIVTVEDGVDSDGDTVPAGTADGTYVKLTFQNVSTPVYINVEDLVDVYTGGTTAEATVSISNANEITVTINEINGSKLAATSVAKGKLATAVQDSLDLADSAVQSVAEGATNGTVAVDGTDVAVHGLGSAAYTASTAYEAAGSISTAIGALDADLDASGTAQHSGTFVVSGVTEVDGVITAVDSTEVEAAGAAATAKSEVIGSSTDTASASTIYGAKAYADASTEAIATADITALFD